MPVQMQIDITGMHEVEDKLRALGVEVMPMTLRQIYNKLLGIRNTLTKLGEKPPSYPPRWVNWDSEKQRRAFFATNGFGRGIPTSRTGTYARSWRVLKDGDGYMLDNPTPYAVYVGGDVEMSRQSRIHAGRWQLWAERLEQEINKIAPDTEVDIRNFWNK